MAIFDSYVKFPEGIPGNWFLAKVLSAQERFCAEFIWTVRVLKKDHEQGL